MQTCEQCYLSDFRIRSFMLGKRARWSSAHLEKHVFKLASNCFSLSGGYSSGFGPNCCFCLSKHVIVQRPIWFYNWNHNFCNLIVTLALIMKCKESEIVADSFLSLIFNNLNDKIIYDQRKESNLETWYIHDICRFYANWVNHITLYWLCIDSAHQHQAGTKRTSKKMRNFNYFNAYLRLLFFITGLVDGRNGSLNWLCSYVI